MTVLRKVFFMFSNNLCPLFSEEVPFPPPQVSPRWLGRLGLLLVWGVHTALRRVLLFHGFSTFPSASAVQWEVFCNCFSCLYAPSGELLAYSVISPRRLYQTGYADCFVYIRDFGYNFAKNAISEVIHLVKLSEQSRDNASMAFKGPPCRRS